MRNIKAGKYDCATSSLIDLARVADEALLNGDNTRCIAIIEHIYDLLERRAFCQRDEGGDVAASGGTFLVARRTSVMHNGCDENGTILRSDYRT